MANSKPCTIWLQNATDQCLSMPFVGWTSIPAIFQLFSYQGSMAWQRIRKRRFSRASLHRSLAIDTATLGSKSWHTSAAGWDLCLESIFRRYLNMIFEHGKYGEIMQWSICIPQSCWSELLLASASAPGLDHLSLCHVSTWEISRNSPDLKTWFIDQHEQAVIKLRSIWFGDKSHNNNEVPSDSFAVWSWLIRTLESVVYW